MLGLAPPVSEITANKELIREASDFDFLELTGGSKIRIVVSVSCRRPLSSASSCVCGA